MTRGKFIIVEGVDGSGKTTQVARVHQYLLDHGITAIKTREPGGTPGAEELRNLVVRGDPGRWDAVTEFLIFSAARRDHLAKCIIPALEDGTWVVCDRFTLSTYAMQVYAGGVDAALFDSVTRNILGTLRPDLTYYLEIDAATSVARTDARESGTQRSGETRMECKGHDYLERVLLGYREAIDHHQLRYTRYSSQIVRYLTVDARKTIDEVTDAITGGLLRELEHADLHEASIYDLHTRGYRFIS